MLKRREQPVCQMCGQRMLIRHGVRLSPMLADLFDLIERTGTAGIESEVLAGVLYPGKPLRDARRCINVNVSYLNARLAETNIEVWAGHPTRKPNSRRGWITEPYRVRRRKSEA